MTISAEVILDSISDQGIRLTTLELTYPRFIHAEFMTHRSFCLAGDARLDFELPGKSSSGTRRVYSMTIKDFVDKWESGAAAGKAPRHNGNYLSLPSRASYSASEIAKILGFVSALNLNDACRKGLVSGAEKLAGQWVASAEAWEQWRNKTGSRRFSIRKRLAAMLIRQIDETTGQIRLSKVVAVQRSGLKNVYTLRTRNYEVTGSADHLIFTERGWVRIGDLIVGQDKVATYKYGTGLKEDPFKKIDGKWVNRWNNSVRDEVAARQGHRCVETNEPLTSDFHIHHVQPRHKRPDLAFDITNVVALNPEAHRALHGIQGWQKGVPLQSGFETVEDISLRGEEETFDLEIAGEFPNFFANGIVVHNSRNAASSRAIPVTKVLEQVMTNPAMPIRWGLYGKGMQDHGEMSELGAARAKTNWLKARDAAVKHVQEMVQGTEPPHKQIVNRLLEPFMHMTVIVTATEWNNFLHLRDDSAAQPEMQELARQVKKAIKDSVPSRLAPGMWHLPYVFNEDIDDTIKDMTPAIQMGVFSEESLTSLAIERGIKISAARCARVSYLNHDKKRPTFEEDLNTFNILTKGGKLHGSPLEHQATPDIWTNDGWAEPHYHGNFRGWVQYRKTWVGENVAGHEKPQMVAEFTLD
jgi:hypothetical protein